MMYATGVAGDSEAQNELFGNITHLNDLKRRRSIYRERNNTITNRAVFVYSVRGRKMCRESFAHMVCLNAQTISRHANIVTTAPSFLLYDTRHNESREGKLGVHRNIVDGYLNYVEDTHGLECPSGRGSAEDKPLMILPSDMIRTEVYNDYVKCFPSLSDAVHMGTIIQVPSEPLTFSAFTRYWDRGHPRLRVAKTGSDFCDLCTTLKNDISELHHSDERYACLKDLLSRHKDAARREHLKYKEDMAFVSGNRDGEFQHIVFDFAEKVLLPQLLKQPGQLYFVTGLKYDIFGVHDSNGGSTFVFGLAEGHWPNEKTANSIVSMLHFLLHEITMEHSGTRVKSLKMHADNCAGQNKNRFVLFYLCWRTLVGLNEEVMLTFMVAGHTKNVVDGAFGHIKRKLKLHGARTPGDMGNIISTSSSTTKFVPSGKVRWLLWKPFLETLFKMPANFGITKYHSFRFSCEHPGLLFAKEFSFSDVEESFCVLKKGFTVQDVQLQSSSLVNDEAYKASIVPLRDVKSAQHGTRHGYLMHNILDRYYKEDARMRKGFFEDGGGSE